MSRASWPAADRVRTSVRVLLLDPDDRLLLIETSDPTQPGLGSWWEVPGGGIENGEEPLDAAVREVAEETGIVLSAGDVRLTDWRRVVTYVRRGIRTLQHEVVAAARVPEAARVDGSGRTAEEAEEFGTWRWWALSEIVAAAPTTRFFPDSLPRRVASAARGALVGEEDEFWN